MPAETVEPRVHFGKNFEVNIRTCNIGEQLPFESNVPDSGIATAVWAPPELTLSLELDPTDLYEYEVLIFDQQRRREFVAAILWPEVRDLSRGRIPWSSDKRCPCYQTG